MIVAWIEHCRKQGLSYGDNLYLNFKDMIGFYGSKFKAGKQMIAPLRTL